MQISLDGKVALVTGASKGIGKAIAASFAAAGAKVMLSSRKQDLLEAAASEMSGETAVFAANAGELEAAEACVDATIERFGGLDILVNNAATNPYYGASSTSMLRASTRRSRSTCADRSSGARRPIIGRSPASRASSSTSPQWVVCGPSSGSASTT